MNVLKAQFFHLKMGITITRPTGFDTKCVQGTHSGPEGSKGSINANRHLCGSHYQLAHQTHRPQPPAGPAMPAAARSLITNGLIGFPGLLLA